MYGYIYITTNLINGKKYIGQKKSSKFLAEAYLGSGVALLRAVAKYGKEVFTVIMLDSADSQEELDKLEIQYIRKYREAEVPLYNIAAGGYTTGGCLGNTTRGKMWVNNGVHQIMVDDSNLQQFLDQGYIRGSLNTKGYVWVTNGSETKHIPLANVPDYLASGYRRGRNSSGKRWITNGTENKCINQGDAIPDGYHPGRIPITAQPSKGKKYMYKEEEQIMVNPQDVGEYLNLGYKFGKHPRSSIKGRPGSANLKGYRWMTNGINNVLTNDIDNYTDRGYVFGRTLNTHSK